MNKISIAFTYLVPTSMPINMIKSCLFTSLFYQVESFSALHRNHSKPKIFKFNLFGTSATSTIDTYRSKKNRYYGGDEAKLFFQSQKDFKRLDDNGVNVEQMLPFKENNLKSLSKMKSLAQEAMFLVKNLRSTATLIDDDICNTSNSQKEDSHYCVIKERYESALKQARDADLKYGLCSDESLDAWEIVDEVYAKLENYGNLEESHKLNNIVEACDLLETAFVEFRDKVN